MNLISHPIARRGLEAFFRHRVLFIISVLLVTGVVTGALLLRGRTYTASASTYVVPESEVSDALGFTKQIYISPAQLNVNHFNDLLRDDLPGGFLDTALKNAELTQPINVDPQVNDKRLELLRKRLYARVDSNDVFTIGLTWDNAAECERIVASLQKHYIEDAGSTRQARSLATTNFLDQQITEYEKRMRSAEQILIDFKQKNFGQLPEAQSAEIKQLAELKAKRDDLTINSRDSDLRIATLQQRLTEIPKQTVLQQTTAAMTEQGPKQMLLRELQSQRAKLIAQSYLPSSESVLELDARIKQVLPDVAAERAQQIAQIQSNIVGKTVQDNPAYLEVSRALTEAKIQKQTVAAQIGNLNKTIAESEHRVSKLPAAARELTDRTRDYEVLKHQYDDLVERREQARIKADLDRVQATATLTPMGAVFARSTASGKKIMLLAVASLVMGLVVGVGMIVVGEWMDPSLRYEMDTEHYLGVPVLAALPQVNVGRTGALAALPGGMGSAAALPAATPNFGHGGEAAD